MDTVFIADDNDIDRIILESGLQKLDYEVVSFSRGSTAAVTNLPPVHRSTDDPPTDT